MHEDPHAHTPSVAHHDVKTRPSASEIHSSVLHAAHEEDQREALPLLFSAFAAGLTISFSFLLGGFLRGMTEDPHRHHLMVALGYPLGFILVALARQELFTENTLKPVTPFLEHPSRHTFGRMLRMWGLLLLGNIVGALIIGLVLARTAAVPEYVRDHLLPMARHATDGGFVIVLYKAIFAGWLLALLSWMMASTRERITQVVLIFLTTAPIAALGFRHAITGSVEAFYRVGVGDAGAGHLLMHFVIPAIVGNAIGGVVMVALLNHAQSKEKKLTSEEHLLKERQREREREHAEAYAAHRNL